MIFFLDENFPKSAEKILLAKGHHTIDIRGTKKEGLDDHSLFQMAQENAAIFLSTDKDFFHTVPFSFPVHCGVVIFNLRQPNRYNIIEKLVWFLDNIKLDEISDKVFLLKDNDISLIESSKKGKP